MPRMGAPPRWWCRPALPDALVIAASIIAIAAVLRLLWPTLVALAGGAP